MPVQSRCSLSNCVAQTSVCWRTRGKPASRVGGPGRSFHNAAVGREFRLASVSGLGSAAEPTLLDLMNYVANGQLKPEYAAQQLSHIASGVVAGDGAAADVVLTQPPKAFPEVVWGPGKTPQQLASVLVKFAEEQHVAIATRVEPQVFSAVQEILPTAEYNSAAGCVLLENKRAGKVKRLPGTVAIVSACTSDPRVVEECRVVAEAMGCYAFKRTDVEVARLEHLMKAAQSLRVADVVVVVCGVDAALPSLIAGLVDTPVIAVPSSQSYGGMVPAHCSPLPACAPGVAVVNPDSGFGAAMLATRILARMARTMEQLQARMGGAANP